MSLRSSFVFVFATLVAMLLAPLSMAGPGYQINTFITTPANVPKLIAATEKLQSAPIMKKSKGRLLLLANLADGNAPGPESSMEKIGWSEFHQRLTEASIDLLGPEGQLNLRSPGARQDVDWPREFLWARAGTICSGSSEIQRNIIAKRVLRMPMK